MATRISGDFGLSGQALIRTLRRKAPKGEIEANFVGLQRSLALSDVRDSSKSLDNILEKISITEVSERNQYGGPYNALDWKVTDRFDEEGINKSFLSKLYNTSVGGGSLGATVSITPRIRIQDRLGFIKAFYGEGSFPGVHSGPDAQFYKSPLPNHIGYIKFTFDSGTGSVNVTELKQPDGNTDLTVGSILGDETEVVLDLEEYETTNGIEINIGGFGISLKLSGGSTWTVSGSGALNNLNSTSDSNDSFGDLRFKLMRPYSFKYKPLWFTQSPDDSNVGADGGADDLDPSTTNRLINNVAGNILPYTERGYWYTGAYIEERWTVKERELLTYYGVNNRLVVGDSNMRWQNPPLRLKSQTYNWGIRWDGYLSIEAGIYSFKILTNVAIKIDMALNSDKSWVNVFGTDGNSAQISEKNYVSSQSFNTNNLHDDYKYVYGSGNDDWNGYVPITIRMYHGGQDKSEPEILIGGDPNLFIKTTSLGAEQNYYFEEYVVTLSGSDGNWGVTSGNLTEIISVIQDTDASVNYNITAEGDTILTEPIGISLATNGSTVTSNTTGLSETTYTLSITPLLSTEFNENLTPLWKGRISSPAKTHTNYSDLTDGSYEPNLKKVAFDSLPQWWKVSEGNPYEFNSTSSKSNTPLDGFVPNLFKPVLESDAGIGLYGDGSGSYTNKPNIIFGESRYGTNSELGSNYIGLRLVPNLLGEGGKLNLTALPVNSIESNDGTIAGQNDLGGGSNHLTVADGKVEADVIRLYLSNTSVLNTSDQYNKYHTVVVYNGSLPTSDVGRIYNESDNKFYEWDGSASSYTEDTSPTADNPATYGLPDFTDSDWLSPITVTVTRVADNQSITTNVTPLTAPLTMTVEKVTLGGINMLQFSTTQASLLYELGTAGEDVSSFSGKYIEYYNEDNVASQYIRVDDGRSLSFADVLKLTFDENDDFQRTFSEVPSAPSSRVIPFGFDKPEFSSGVCYPPYSITNPLLSEIAIEDSDLYAESAGNYDVFWGYPGEIRLDNKFLEITEKIEFIQSDTNSNDVVEDLTTPVVVNYDDYTHRLKVDMPLSGIYDSDQLIHIGNNEKARESYYAYVKLDS